MILALRAWVHTIRWWDALVYCTLLVAIIIAITNSIRVTNVESHQNTVKREVSPCVNLSTRQCAIKLLGALTAGQREEIIREVARVRDQLIRQEVRKDRAEARRRSRTLRQRVSQRGTTNGEPITALPGPANPPTPAPSGGGGGPPSGGNGTGGGSDTSGGSGGHQESPPLVPPVTTPVVTTPAVPNPVPPIVCHVVKDC